MGAILYRHTCMKLEGEAERMDRRAKNDWELGCCCWECPSEWGECWRGAWEAAKAGRGLTEEEMEAALRLVSAEDMEKFRREDGSIDYKAMSKSVPLQADYTPLDVVFEDEGLLVVSKPSGVPMNPPHRFSSGTLVNMVIGHTGEAPFVAHRLDVWTSGVVVFAKRKDYVKELHRQFRERTVKKEYLLICDGDPPPGEGFTVDAAIGTSEGSSLRRVVDGFDAKECQTFFVVDSRSPDGRFAVLRAKPRTGRTHQIRVHASHMGLPILGDNVYGAEASLYIDDQDLMETNAKKIQRTLESDPDGIRVPLKLHAHTLEFAHPET
eukprot:CAMPEP_0172049534 /NCGR_PEP_ID=MMETSP1043-20130122/2129_1 /TAXON_ID=464988 /ORGANISM="Hemiselmis andersenii, Strain CCMP441" /LENGTH=322 /DNA_ID=CAMNT_0012708533 /DNA_START=112 /DNA_END=1077 /DNA_ORIENTATION=+